MLDSDSRINKSMQEVKLSVNLLSGRNKVIGLINAKNPEKVLIKTRFGIHTFGVKFPLDILVLNKNSNVVKTMKSMKPNRIFVWSPIFDTIIELPKGEINKLGIEIGSKINLQIT